MVRPKVVIPEKGIPYKELFNNMEEISKDDIEWRDGKVWSLVYHASDDHDEFLKKAYTKFFSKNALSPMAFPSLRKFETEVVSMAIDLFNGDKKCCGSMTSGGTESILMAIKTYREWAKEKFSVIKEPEMVIPSSAHPSFDKGADYFGVKAIKVPVDQKTHRADVSAMKNAITDNTIMMVGSACDFPRGVVDPISELAKIEPACGEKFHGDALGREQVLWKFEIKVLFGLERPNIQTITYSPYLRPCLGVPADRENAFPGLVMGKSHCYPSGELLALPEVEFEKELIPVVEADSRGVGLRRVLFDDTADIVG